jgi:hypothetical protein
METTPKLNEFPLWTGESCPFCGKETVRTLETVDGPDVISRIGFFVCQSCEENWASLCVSSPA